MSDKPKQQLTLEQTEYAGNISLALQYSESVYTPPLNFGAFDASIPYNFGGTRFYKEWEVDYVYPYDPILFTFTVMVTFNGGLYVLTDTPNGLSPAVDTAWTQIASLGASTLGTFQGFYNASTNTPTLVNGTGNNGDWYITSVGGSNNPTGETLVINQIVAYTAANVWEAGSIIDSTDELVVANGYAPITGETIQAGQVLTRALGINAGNIATNATAIAGNTANIATNTANIATNTANIATNTTNISANTVKINTNTANIATNTSNIATNTTNISANTAKINTNTANIATNTTNIAANTVKINTNTANIATNTANIATNTSNIALKANLQPAVQGGNQIASVNNVGQYVASGILQTAMTAQGNTFNGANQLVQLTATGLPAVVSNATLVTNPVTSTQTALSVALQDLADGGAGTGTVTNVSSANADITVANPTTTPVLTLNSGINANQIVKLTATGLPAVVSNATLVTNPVTSTQTALSVALQDLADGGTGTGTVTNVSSANADITVANPTTTPVLTLNGTVDGTGANANKVVKLDGNGNLGAINVGLNALALNPKTIELTTVNQALQDAYGSVPNIPIANTVFVAKNGNDTTGTGAINKPYLTIQKAIDASPANTQIYVYSSGLVATATAYTENITLKASQVITGASSQFVVISGTVTTPTTGGTCYLENLRIQTPSTAGNVSPINFAGGANVSNLQLSNCDINLYGGTGSCINWTNTNSASKLSSDGTSAWNVISSANNAKLFTSLTGTAGTVILQNVSAQINDNINNKSYAIGGAVKFYHTLDNIYGQVVVSDTAQFFGTFLTIITGNVAALVTNSSSISTLNSCVMTTTANALAGTAVVEGVGFFAFYQTSTPNTTTKGFATTLNAGKGAIAAPTYSLRLDSSGIAPFKVGTSDGLIQYDSNNYYVDTATARYKLATADNTTNKLLSTWLNYNLTPTFANKTATDVMSSSSLWSSLPQVVGTNLTYDPATGRINATGGTYTLPAATTTTLGGVLVPTAGGITVNAGAIQNNYNQTPIYSATAPNDVISSQSLFYALSNLAGTNLTYTNGKLNATGGGAGGTYAVADGYLSGEYLPVSGTFNFTVAENQSVSGCTITASGITLLPNRTYQFNMMLPVKTAGQPDLNTFMLKYTGNATNPPIYPLTTDTMNVINGSITNNIFTANTSNGQVQSKGNAITGALTQYTPGAIMYPYTCQIGEVSTTNTNWSVYSRIPVPDNILFKTGDSINFLNGATKAATGAPNLGTNTGLWTIFVNPVAPSGTYFNGGGEANDKYSVLYGNGSTQQSVYFKTLSASGWTATPAQTTPQVYASRTNSGLSDNFFLAINNTKQGYRFNLDTNTATPLTLPNANPNVVLRDVAHGELGVGIKGFGIANNYTASWDTIYTLANNSTTINTVATNIKALVPAADEMSSLEFNNTDKHWYAIVWDYTNSNSYFLKSTNPRDLANWDLFQTLNGNLYGSLTYCATKGVNMNGSMMVATKVSKTGVEANITVCSVNSNQFAGITNDLTLVGVAPTMHPSGVIVLSSSSSTQSYKFSYDGSNWQNGTASSNAQGFFVPTLLGFCKINTGYGWNYITASYFTTISNPSPNLIPDEVWTGGQYLTSVFGSTAQHQITSYVANGNGMNVATDTIQIASNNTFTNIQIGVAGLNVSEQATNVYATMLTLLNSVKLTASSSVGSTLTTTPQYAIAQYDRIQLSGLVVTGTTTATLSVDGGFAVTPIKVLAGATLTVTEV